MAASFVSKLPVCNTLDPATVASIANICAFGVCCSVDKSCIFITKDDDVFSMGCNEDGCLGLGDKCNRDHPEKIIQLSKRRVKSITWGVYGHVLAVTECGKLFSWGHNSYGQLGNGNFNNVLIPIQVTHLEDKKIIQVACGLFYSMALSHDGEIFAWGYNVFGQLGLGSTTKESSPHSVILTKAVSIACGLHHSVAVLDNGEVYCWGYNGSGQLGLGDTLKRLKPCKVEALSGTVIKQIVCGYSYTLALSEDGAVYSWGGNNYGQLGTGNKTNLLTPQKINTEERFIEIAAHHSSHTSAALTQSGKVFMWGNCRGKFITSPLLTEVSTTDHVFVLFSLGKDTWRMYPGDVLPNVDAITLDKVRRCDDGDSVMKERFYNSEEVYNMKGRTTGVHVLIINNKTFTEKARDTNKPLNERAGTDIDAESLYLLFTQLGYKSVNTKTDLTGEGIVSALQEEAQNFQKTDNAFICFILSHGTVASVYGVDGQPVELENLYNLFNGQNCPNLVGKPKVFFIQACRGGKKDGGVEEPDTAVELNKACSSLQIEEEHAHNAPASPTMADILVATATTEGYVSWRNSEEGSWFIQALVHVIQNDAYKCDLLQILTKTNALVGNKATKLEPGYKQSCEKRDTFRKQFYFFPGFKEEPGYKQSAEKRDSFGKQEGGKKDEKTCVIS